jgi:hypothetical protein
MKAGAGDDKAVALAMMRTRPAGPSFLSPPPREPSPCLRIPYNLDDEDMPGDWTLWPTGLSKSQNKVAEPIELHHALSGLTLNTLAQSGSNSTTDTSSAEPDHAIKQARERKIQEETNGEIERGRRLTNRPSSAPSVGTSKNLLR